ncbi:unnamed protein product [Discula destructiva]
MASSTALPPQHLAKLSPHPFLLANLSQPATAASSSSTAPTRANHRAPNEARPLKINASSLSHAHGSAMVRIGDTAVLCGVRGELLPATSIPQWRAPKTPLDQEALTEAEARAESAREMRDYDLLVPNIELATGCAPQFLPGVPPSTLAQTLSTRVYSLLHGSGMLDAEDLRVWYTPPDLSGDDNHDDDAEEEQLTTTTTTTTTTREVKAYWTLYIDVLFLSFDGNPFDAAWIAVLAALRDTKLPRAWWDADREMVLCARGEEKALRLSGLPVACTAAVLAEKEREPAVSGKQQQQQQQQQQGLVGKTWVLVDPDREEDKLCQESVTVVVDLSEGETRMRGIEKVGGRTLGPEEIRGVVGMAEKRWKDVWEAVLS